MPTTASLPEEGRGRTARRLALWPRDRVSRQASGSAGGGVQASACGVLSDLHVVSARNPIVRVVVVA
jgi:hypothetical protein